MTVHRLHRIVDLHHPEPLRVEIHAQDCDCPACAPYLQAAPRENRRLNFVQIGNLVWIGLAIGTAVAFAIDPHGAWRALLAIVGR